MVFLQGAGRPAGPARACFHLVDQNRVTLCIGNDIIAEVRDVLTRPKTQKRFPLLSPQWADAFVQNVEAKAVLLADVPKAETLERDPKDEPYLNLALAARARYLVSCDRDLLDLMDDKGFRERHLDLLVLNPAAFLNEIARLEATGPTTQTPPESTP